MSNNTLLEVKNLKQYFPIKGGIFGKTVNHVKAVDDITFEVLEGDLPSGLSYGSVTIHPQTRPSWQVI